MCPRGGRLFGGEGGPWAVAPMCCHCLLIEGEDGLVLVDSGLGVEDVADPRRLGFLFTALTRPRLEVGETALRQVADLGFRVDDVRHIVPTHLDLDHAGGLADFPAATVHVHAAELRAAKAPTWRERQRYRRAQLDASPAGTRSRSAATLVRLRRRPRAAGNARRRAARPAARPFARPLRRRGAHGVGLAVSLRRRLFPPRRGRARGRRRRRSGVRLFESLVNVDRAARVANQKRLRELAKAPCRRGQADLVARPGGARGAPRLKLSRPRPAARSWRGDRAPPRRRRRARRGRRRRNFRAPWRAPRPVSAATAKCACAATRPVRDRARPRRRPPPGRRARSRSPSPA